MVMGNTTQLLKPPVVMGNITFEASKCTRYDGDFFVPLIRLDLLERDQLPLPNTWEEVLALAERPLGERLKMEIC